MQVEMTVVGLTIDPGNNAPIVILREKDGERMLPIWIGVVEASAIAFELESIKLMRPMTHDLMREMIQQLGGKLERVAIVELRENTYYARLMLAQAERRIEIDARPSDAIALALRTHAAILCEESVIEQAQALRQGAAAGTAASAAKAEEEVDRGEGGPRPIVDPGDKPWRELLEELDPEAFGKYKM